MSSLCLNGLFTENWKGWQAVLTVACLTRLPDSTARLACYCKQDALCTLSYCTVVMTCTLNQIFLGVRK